MSDIPLFYWDTCVIIAWLKNEINTHQAMSVYGGEGKRSANYLYRIALSIKEAYRNGKLKIVA